MFNNNSGQGYQVEDYFKSEAYVRGLKNDLLDQESRLQRQSNNLADWQCAYHTIEHALGQWQQAHAQQAQEIARLNERYANLDKDADGAIESWKKYSNRLKEDNSKLQARADEQQQEINSLQARVIDQQKAIDQLQVERLNHVPTAIEDDAQDTITALRQMNTQLQAQVSALETEMRLLDATEREQRLTDLLKQNARLAGKVIDAAHEIQADMTASARSLSELQSLHDVVEAQGLHLEDDLRLES